NEIALWSDVLAVFRGVLYLQHGTKVIPLLKGNDFREYSPQNQEFPVTAFPEIIQVSIRANESDLEAQVMLRDMCYEGKGGDSQNYHDAMHWYLQTAEQGDPEGQRKVRLIYEYGAGVSRDLTKAVAWCLKAVAQRNGISQIRMAYSYSKGQGVPRNYQNRRLVHQIGGAGGYKSAV
ncbi:hypothetical protein BGZ89_003460, partial [Linnemannia elongata]